MIKIEFLYPEFHYIYGEKLNIEYFERMSKDVEVIYTSHNEKPKFISNDINLLYLGCLTENKQEEVIELLRPYREDIKRKIDENMFFLITGNSIEIFGNEIKENDKVIKGLSLFDFYSIRNLDIPRHNSQFYGKVEGVEIVGHRSQFSFSYGKFDHPLLEVEKGIGMNKDTKLEGIHINNFYATYSLGPFLIINPYFTKYLQRKLGLVENIEFEDVVNNAFELRKNELITKL